MVPHGQAVSLTAPECFRFTFPTAPDRHLRAAGLLDPGQDKTDDPAEQLPQALIRLMRDIAIPNGISAVGYTESDASDLARGTMQQHRLVAGCPRDVTQDDITAILTGSLQNW
jgi:alcohol dehydrogenase class IV